MNDKFRRESANADQVGRSIDHADYQHVPRVMTAMARDEVAGSYIPRHSHPRGQLLYATSGLMRAETDEGIWLLPPQRGLWIPANIVHDQRMLSSTTIRTIYIEQSMGQKLGERCRTIEVSPLLRELILSLVGQPIEYELDERSEHLVALILIELQMARRTALEIPWPKDRRLLVMCEAILKTPHEPMTIEYWSKRVGASSRTLIRLFIKETGQTFRTWVHQVRLAEALSRLEMGASVATVANDLGYVSPSAFAAMFRKTMGQSPTAYLANH